jgi:tetratricopeptide (TPR) repeat protein
MSRRTPNLREIPPFSGLPDEQRRYLQGRLQRYEFDAGEVIIRAGARGYYMAIVGRGRLELVDRQGQLSSLGPGQGFGQGMLRYGVPSAHTVTAVVKTRLWVITRPDWIDCLNLPVAQPDRPAIPRWPRRLAGALIVLAILALIAVFLGPTLFNYANQALPQSLVAAGQPALAVQYLKLAARIDPTSTQVYESLGGFYYDQGDSAGALEAYQRAVALDAFSATAQNNLGVLLLAGGDFAGASERLQAAVKLQPGNAQIYHNLGNARLAAGDLSAAAGAYRRAYELDPNDLDARALWAGVLLRQGKYDLARQAWEWIAQESPDYPTAALGLGVTSILDEQPETALPYLETACDANPNDPVARFYRGLAYQALGRPSEAAAEFELARSLSWDIELVNLAESYLNTIPK